MHQDDLRKYFYHYLHYYEPKLKRCRCGSKVVFRFQDNQDSLKIGIDHIGSRRSSSCCCTASRVVSSVQCTASGGLAVAHALDSLKTLWNKFVEGVQ